MNKKRILSMVLVFIMTIATLSMPVTTVVQASPENIALNKGGEFPKTSGPAGAGTSGGITTNYLTKYVNDGLVDGDGVLYWRTMSSEPLPIKLMIDFGQPKTFNRVILKEAERYKNSIQRLKIQYSTTGEESDFMANNLYESSEDEKIWDYGKSNINDGKVYDFNEVTARYIRLYIDGKPEGKTSIGLTEFEVYNDKSGISGEISEDMSFDATVTVFNEVVGKSIKYVGYSAMDIVKGTNLPQWYDYSNINSARYWVHPATAIPESCVKNSGVASLADFDKSKDDLRAKAVATEGDQSYLNWDGIYKSFDEQFSSGGGLKQFAFGISEFKRLGIDVIAELSDHQYKTEFKDESEKWARTWKIWQIYYASAYYIAKNFDIDLFEGPNEPDLGNNIPRTPADLNKKITEQYLFMNAVISDAIKAAVRDVNTIYGKNLNPQYAAPTAASMSGEFVPAVLRSMRTDYRGNTVDYNIIDIFVVHTYRGNAADYVKQINDLKALMKQNHPTGEVVPIIYTEFNYSTAGNWNESLFTSDKPDVFRDMSQVWAESMSAGAYGMYQFKFADFEKGNRVHYLFGQSRDTAENLLYGKSYTVSSEEEGFSVKNVLLGAVTNNIAWKSKAGAAGLHFIEWDLGQEYPVQALVVDAVVSDDAMKVGVIKYWNSSANKWETMPVGQINKESINFLIENPILTSKIRYESSYSGQVTVNRIYVSDKPSTVHVGGPTKSAEVTRLFAEGFKGERPLYKTVAQTKAHNDSKYKSYTSFSAEEGCYYIWLPQSNDVLKYNTTVDLSNLDVSEGDLVLIKEVSKNHFGEVVYKGKLNSSKKVTMIQPPQSVWQISIHKAQGGEIQGLTLSPTDDAQVSLGSAASENYGFASAIKVNQNTTDINSNSAAYIKFNTGDLQPSQIKKAILNIHGVKPTGKPQESFYAHVYGITNDAWSENTITGATAPNFGKGIAVVLGEGAEPVGHLSFTGVEEICSVDVTRFVKSNMDKELTFVVVKEKRREQELNDTDYFILSSKESSNSPELELYTDPTSLQGGIKVALNGANLDFDVPPINRGGRVLVPLRKIFEAMGASIVWAEETQTITANSNGKEITLRIDDNNATINGATVQLDVPPIVINGRTLVPVRFIAESLGADVQWDGLSNTVIIKK